MAQLPETITHTISADWLSDDIEITTEVSVSNGPGRVVVTLARTPQTKNRLKDFEAMARRGRTHG
jgi:hypothetical protein